MPLQIIQGEITAIELDAVVRFTGGALPPPGGEGPVSERPGPELQEVCRAPEGCGADEARDTGSASLPWGCIVHTPAPAWQGGNHGDRALLVQACCAALELARKHGCSSVAVPLLPFEDYGWPRDLALDVEMEAIRQFLLQYDINVRLVVSPHEKYRLRQRLVSGISCYIRDFYIGDQAAPVPAGPRPSTPFPPDGLVETLNQLDEIFSQMLLRKIDEAGMTDVQCYKKANISRRLFSKIRSDCYYQPSKPTVLAFAISLELSLEETRQLLQTAGFALSHASKFDLIVEYFITRKNYNVFEINQALFAFGQGRLGG